jgi:hypothetical protein
VDSQFLPFRLVIFLALTIAVTIFNEVDLQSLKLNFTAMINDNMFYQRVDSLADTASRIRTVRNTLTSIIDWAFSIFSKGKKKKILYPFVVVMSFDIPVSTALGIDKFIATSQSVRALLFMLKEQ